MDISVVICTHNPRPPYLRRVLQALRDQTLPLNRWELLLIDNASEEPLEPTTWDLSWHPCGRIIREEKVGLVSARIRGMQEAGADLLVFVDDDNVLDPNYLSEAIRIKFEWPQLGVWGGSIMPEFEVAPSKYLLPFIWHLALREVKGARWSNVIGCSDAQPYGAGFCVRAIVGVEYCQLHERSSLKIDGRNGRDLLSGEDAEICFVACSLGLGMGLFPNLKVVHLIPRERVDEDYLVRVARGTQTSICLLGYKWRGIVPSSPFSLVNLLRHGKYLMLKQRIYRRMYIAGLQGRIIARSIIADSPQWLPAKDI